MEKRFFSFLLIVFSCLLLPAQHVMLESVFRDSKIYPGTERAFSVYIPHQYTGKEAACLCVGLDGPICNAPLVMDSLIGQKKMPVTIGVFLQPGVIKNKQGEVLRYNRSNEFDMTTADFARFLETELLPAVLKMKTSDGKDIKISANPDDRMIFGLSSGGIASFNAAWQRPDLFHRVFCGVGTFVPMRGGNDLMAIVRKHEPQPLRLFVQDTTHDSWNPLFGSWYEANRMMATALEFAGYDAAFDWSEGTHNGIRSTKIFSNVMEWLWRDWPQPIKNGSTQNNLLKDLLPIGESATWVKTTSTAPPTPAVNHDSVAAVYPDGTLAVVAHSGSNCLWQYIIDKQGHLQYGQRFYWLHTYDNAQLPFGPMAFDGNGNLFVVTNSGLQILDQNGRVRAILKMPDVTPQECTHLQIEDGKLSIQTAKGKVFSRKLNIKAAQKGIRPKSQGQG